MKTKSPFQDRERRGKTLLFSITGIFALAAVITALAQTIPTYQTFSVPQGTASAALLIPQSLTSQIRVVSAIVTSDQTASKLNIYTGLTAHYVNLANTNASATNVIVESTNGLSAGQLIFIQTPTSNVVATIYGFANATNIQTTAAVGAAQTLYDEVELLTNNISLSVGVNTNKVYASDGLFVGQEGRAVYMTLAGGTNCGLDSITIHRDATSQ